MNARLASDVLKAYEEGSLKGFTNQQLLQAVETLDFVSSFLTMHGDRLAAFALNIKANGINDALRSRKDFEALQKGKVMKRGEIDMIVGGTDGKSNP